MINIDRKFFENIWLYIYYVIFNKVIYFFSFFFNKMSLVVLKKYDNILLIFFYGRDKVSKNKLFVVVVDIESSVDSLWEF